MTERKITTLVGQGILAIALVLGLTASAQADPIYPDMTVTDLSVFYNGSILLVESGAGDASFISWTEPGGPAPGVGSGVLGHLSLNSITSAFSVTSGATNLLLGTVVPSSIFASIGAPSSFLATVLLTTSTVAGFDVGRYVSFQLTSFNFSGNANSSFEAQADIFPASVPDSGSALNLIAASMALMAGASRLRRRA